VKKLLIIIPARKGSKRLKNKNVLKLGSKSLVEKTIIFAKKLVTKNQIILSSDSKKNPTDWNKAPNLCSLAKTSEFITKLFDNF